MDEQVHGENGVLGEGSDGKQPDGEGNMGDVGRHALCEARYQQLLASVTDYIYRVTVHEGRAIATMHSAACVAVTGFTPAEYAVNPFLWLEMVHPDDREAVGQHAETVLSGGGVASLEHRIVRKDGAIRWVRNTPVPILDGEGTLIAYDGLVMDITDRKLAEEEILTLNRELEGHVAERTARLLETNRKLKSEIRKRGRAQKEIGRLNDDLRERAAELELAYHELESYSYSVSHDLRTPLRHIKSFSEAMLEDFGALLPPQGVDYLDRICRASDRMERMIEALLELSHISLREMAREPVDLSDAAIEIASQLRQARTDRDVTFRIAEGLRCEGDPHLVRILLANLLENAWKYSGRKEEALIEFGEMEGGDRPVFFVRDNGAGFDMAYADRLFVPFQRLHRSDEFEGTGIGLATVRSIVCRHGGRVWADSHVGIGATFFFSM